MLSKPRQLWNIGENLLPTVAFSGRKDIIPYLALTEGIPLSILYMLTSPKPALEGTDAVFQEVDLLQSTFGGDSVNLMPFKNPGSRFPRQLFGFHVLRKIRELERQCTINHVYYSSPYVFPILNFLKNPIVYTVTAGLNAKKMPANITALEAMQQIVVSNERDAAILRTWNISNYSIVPPGLDSSGLVSTSMPLKNELILLMASAPWVEKQFDLKGIDVLLEAVAKLPNLRLILLWRGLLYHELIERIQRLGISDKVEIINHYVDVNEYLKRAHATVLLAKQADIVKSFPNSLMESLTAGKPVLVSDTIPIADMVQINQCGIVVKDIRFQGLVEAINKLMVGYAGLADKARKCGKNIFSERAMLESYRHIYGQ